MRNIADPDFFAQANLALCRGSHVAQGYRDSKNPGDGWVAGGTSIFYWFMSSLYNRSRANMGLSANLNGTDRKTSMYNVDVNPSLWATLTFVEE